MSTNRQIAVSLALLAATLIALLLIALAQITTSITWYVSSIFIASLVISFVSINFVIKKNQQNQRQLLLHALKLDISTNQSLQDILCNQASKTSIAGKNIDDKASELAINSAEVSFFLEKLSGAIELSSEDVDRLASAAEQMSISIKVMNENAAIASQQSSQAMTATSAGSQQLNENVEVIEQLNSDVINAAEKIKSLSQKATKIQNITNVIDGISRQTNLLALNAAIEAARAGEQGRGFAVVADEVRALASKTAEATDQIGSMLTQINEETLQTTEVMAQVVEQSHNIVSSMGSLAISLSDINQKMTESSDASNLISNALEEHNATSDEISMAITNLHDFLLEKSKETHIVSDKAKALCESTESIFIDLAEFKTGSLVEKICWQAQLAAQQVATMFSDKISRNEISQQALFNFSYSKIANTNPQKYHSTFDDFTDKFLPAIQEPILKENLEVVFAGAVDINGYFPTHNQRYSQPLTGNIATDSINNRTKRIFDDSTGIRCGQHTHKFLLQTYKRDTGEVMHDVSAPIIVNGQHWGGFRIGFKAQ
ncbi:methyl-accepting chemotaxis protein [Colwellia sp. MB3u-70]|uniref:methyl-accepting chemotaxis protein n=1 Tax=unclassified Colwellia TaxID=196834 RepID=UPI0015F6E2F0|nr:MULTISPECIES: methyl-accepting chemotaxis protein [unclassified Colwellia]MBA6293159.1 methyl-accepting chemotaxis protein [Colwellia sp. MB3u-8]MBA6307069.1 methyl-accepting chemotaxis protein [Colwellia sp. MB3u-70]